jgi:outer membrane lipoprotein SlyB
VGNVGGTLVGGIAGNSIGGGRGQAISTIVGAAIGGITGQATEERLTRKQGQEIHIQMDNGQVLSVVQEVVDDAFFRAGDRVRLLKLNGVARVSY